MLLFASVMVQAKDNGIPSEIFKNGKVKYEKSTNTLVLEDGFMFSFGDGMPAKRVRITPEVQK